MHTLRIVPGVVSIPVPAVVPHVLLGVTPGQSIPRPPSRRYSPATHDNSTARCRRTCRRSLLESAPAMSHHGSSSHRSHRNPRRSVRRVRPRPVMSGPWKHGNVPVIGLVGGIGSGKSTVAGMLASRGAHVLDADAVGHALLDQTPSRESVVRRFGPEVLVARSSDSDTDSARIDRRVLGRIMFRDPRALKDLESILHPRMRRTFEQSIRRVVRRRSHPLVVLDAAVLFEAGWDDLCDATVFVESSAERRGQRVSVSRGWSEADLAARARHQWPLARKRSCSQRVIENYAGLDDLEGQVELCWKDWIRRSRSRARVRPVRPSRPAGPPRRPLPPSRGPLPPPA
jgi:dephospho-CoA kinase